MRLGEKIVASIGLERSNDILGRWLAHHIADLMTKADAAHASTQPDQAALASRACREAILELWRHRSAWPHGWPPPRAAAMAKTLDELGKEPLIFASTSSLLTALQAAHARLLATIVDILAHNDAGESTEAQWLETFGENLTEDEAIILTRATHTNSRLVTIAEAATTLAPDTVEHPLLTLANAYRDLVATYLAPVLTAQAHQHDDSQGGSNS